jgi:hypothetical protein
MGKVFLIVIPLVIFLSGCNIGQEKISHDENIIERHTQNANYRIEKMSNGVYVYSDNIDETGYGIIH